MSTVADLASLGESVATLSKIFASQLQAAGVPPPSLAADAPASFPLEPAIQEPRLQLIEQLTDLLCLATGANDYFHLHAGLYLNFDASVLDVLSRFDFFDQVPLTGSASIDDIVKTTKLPKSLVKRILYYAFTMRVFAPAPGDPEAIVHTALSAHLVRTPALRSWLGHALEEGRAGALRIADALKEFHVGKEQPAEGPDETAFGLGWPRMKNGDRATFYTLGQDGPEDAWRATRFAEAAKETMSNVIEGIDRVVDTFDWEKLGDVSVVDVGGSDGSLAVALAENHPKLKIRVQDLPIIEPIFNDLVGKSSVAERVTFQSHDFFTPQETQADVFVVSRVLHNWSDLHATKILKCMLSGLKPGGYILICDNVLPDASGGKADVPLGVKKSFAGADLHMFTMLNAKERTIADWEYLFTTVGDQIRLEEIRIVPVPGAMKSLIILKSNDAA